MEEPKQRDHPILEASVHSGHRARLLAVLLRLQVDDDEPREQPRLLLLKVDRGGVEGVIQEGGGVPSVDGLRDVGLEKAREGAAANRAIVEPGEACEAILEPQLVRHVARVRIVRVVRQLLRLRQLFGIALPVLAQRAHANHVGASDGNETTTRWLVAEGHQRGAAWKHRPTQRDTAPLGVRSDHEMEIAGARAAIELERVHAVAVRQVRRAFARGAQHERAGEEAIDEQVHHHAIVVDHRAGKAFLDGPSSRGRRGGGGAVDRPVLRLHQPLRHAARLVQHQVHRGGTHEADGGHGARRVRRQARARAHPPARRPDAPMVRRRPPTATYRFSRGGWRILLVPFARTIRRAPTRAAVVERGEAMARRSVAHQRSHLVSRLAA
mmetsp:Transcript_18766/g.50882  ORF Transcript_18766/g.50882 Transcript_18766/m.50882 type:complete len:382 (-) Transcript_18766:58-1203(-)